MNVVKFIVSLLFGLMFMNAGFSKFFNYMPMPELTPEQLKIFEAFGTISWLMPMVAIVEIVGGLLFIFPKTRALGAIVIFPVMVGILVHNFIFEPSGVAIAGPLFLINIWMIADNWKKYRPMFS